jgi:hypothetical protein
MPDWMVVIFQILLVVIWLAGFAWICFTLFAKRDKDE